jgi:hypothetical protein
MGAGLGVGLVLLMVERPDNGAKATWEDIIGMARRGEEVGADTVWVPDEILWRDSEWPVPEAGGTV